MKNDEPFKKEYADRTLMYAKQRQSEEWEKFMGGIGARAVPEVFEAEECPPAPEPPCLCGTCSYMRSLKGTEPSVPFQWWFEVTGITFVISIIVFCYTLAHILKVR